MKHLVNRMLPVFAAGLLFASCSTDDIEPSNNNPDLWQGELAAAPYAKDAVCLAPTGAEINGRAVDYIELSSSGLYFITTLGNDRYNSPKSLRKPKAETRDWLPYESILSGAYTVLGPNRYDMEGFGEMTINSDGTIDITLTDGGNYIWPVTKVDKIPDSALNSRLCRTWNLIDGHIDFLDSDMKKIYTLKLSKEVMADEYIYSISFTSAGRVYRKEYADTGWYGGNWRWSDPSAQLVQVDSDDPDDGEGIFQVLFNGNRMEVMNPWSFDDGEEARWEYSNIPGYENIPYETRYAREYINLNAMN